MKILIINAGSSSIKFQLFEMDDESVIAKGTCHMIGLADPFIEYKAKGKELVKHLPMKDHTQALEVVLDMLVNSELKVINSFDEVAAVGHRCVQGGWLYSESVLITDEVIENLKQTKDISPLHAEANIAGMVGCRKVMPSTPQVVVFDTAFHATMPEKAFMYGIKYEDYQKYHVRKYGFHGTSHRYILAETAKVMGKKPQEIKIVSCHIGNGSSITAIKDGKSTDTTMGFTPLEGVMMGSRSGDIDPTVVSFLAEKKGKTAAEMVNYLNKEGGVLGISGVSSDMRELEEAIKKGNKRAELALEMYCYRILKHIGAMLAVLGGADAIVFTAGVGENDDLVREKILEGLAYIGVDFDKERNRHLPRGTAEELSTAKSKIKVYRIPTNEELLIARDTKQIAKL